MSKNGMKRAAIRVLQVVVGGATLAASAVMLTHPHCIPEMLREVRCGLAAGMLFTVVKVLSHLSRGRFDCKPLSDWWCYGWAVVWEEFECGLIGGYLLGLVMAMWVCLGG